MNALSKVFWDDFFPTSLTSDLQFESLQEIGQHLANPWSHFGLLHN